MTITTVNFPEPNRKEIFILCLLFSGCAGVGKQGPFDHRYQPTVFEPVGVVDFRYDSVEDYAQIVQPGDLIINYMRLGRAAKKREWLFALLPHGHSMIVLDPHAPEGLLECRFHGVRRVGPEELKLYSYNLVFRLRDRSILDLARLHEYADLACAGDSRYDFTTWLGRNRFVRPDSPTDVGNRYSCSTMVAAAYHYAGVRLSAADTERVITPLDVMSSAATPSRFDPLDSHEH